MNIAYFVSSHGFGHAARACAVMQQLAQHFSDLELEIYSETPDAFFRNSLSFPINFHLCKTDVGLLQKTPLLCDIEGSAQRIRDFLQFDDNYLAALAKSLKNSRIDLIVCDISPLGLKVAELSGIDSLLIENFTWDWIYTDYLQVYPQYGQLVDEMAAIFATARWRIKCAPVCDTGGRFDLVVSPLCRKPRNSIAGIRKGLEINDGQKLILLTQGGITGKTHFLEQLADMPQIYFLVTGAEQTGRHGNLIMMKNDASLYLPDYLNACDAVIGKVGYSTVAETWQAGLPIMYITRDSFRESTSLAHFIDESMSGIHLSEDDYARGTWLSRIDELLAMQRIKPSNSHQGLQDVCSFIKKCFPRQ